MPYRRPREGVHEQAAGHTDPHSALGTGALGGVLAAKQALERHGLAGTLVLFGEPAEKVCGSKPIHAAAGLYDDLDAAISFHPAWVPSHANTVYWDTHCGSYWSAVYTFECPEPEGWASVGAGERSNRNVRPRAGRDRRRDAHVHELQDAERGDAAAHRHVDGERGDPRRGPGHGRQRAAPLRPDPVREPRADARDAGACLRRPRP